MKHRTSLPHNHPLRLTALTLLLSLGLSACGSKDDNPQATQVAAKVGSSEISVHQINQVLSRTPINGASKDVVQLASREALERLIDQQLAVDQATENKLHRSPDVVAQLESARRDVLARAYAATQKYDLALAESERRAAKQAFRADVRRHVDAIAAKYILPGTTSDGAVMFLPAEAVFAALGQPAAVTSGARIARAHSPSGSVQRGRAAACGAFGPDATSWSPLADLP